MSERESAALLVCSYDRWGGCEKPPLWRIWTVADGRDDAIERGLACARHLNPILQGLVDHDEFVLDRLDPKQAGTRP